jgi:hypothetical protein
MENTEMSPRVIALYLPQFHPIPENDIWWGKGFTEWTNVAKAKPLFRGHQQPRIPADLGFYDLRMSEVREAQANMARDAGVEGFCYWHYWFGNGRRILERPFNEVLQSGRPDFPFCLAWANHSWSSKTWKKTGKNSEMLIEQRYDGEADYRAHFDAVLPAFKDKRYIRVDGKPLFVIYDVRAIPDVSLFLRLWRRLAGENNLPGIHFVAYSESTSSWRVMPDGEKRRVLPRPDMAGEVFASLLALGVDAIASSGKNRAEMLAKGRYSRLFNIMLHLLGWDRMQKPYDYRCIMGNYYVPEDSWDNVYPSIIPQWDRSPRTGSTYDVYTGSTPELFRESVISAKKRILDKSPEHQILILRSWNEWAEGNYIEPDLRFGDGFVKALKSALTE